MPFWNHVRSKSCSGSRSGNSLKGRIRIKSFWIHNTASFLRAFVWISLCCRCHMKLCLQYMRGYWFSVILCRFKAANTVLATGGAGRNESSLAYLRLFLIRSWLKVLVQYLLFSTLFCMCQYFYLKTMLIPPHPPSENDIFSPARDT